MEVILSEKASDKIDQRAAIAYRVLQRRTEAAKRARSDKGNASRWSEGKPASLSDTLSDKEEPPTKTDTRAAVAKEASALKVGFCPLATYCKALHLSIE